MKFRILLKYFASQTCAECSARQHVTLPRRCLWLATRRNDNENNRYLEKIGKRRLSSGSTDTIIQSSRPDVEFPVTSLSDFMFSRFGKFGNKPALHDFETGHTYRYNELEDLSRRIGSYLTRKGFKKGDVIAYLGTNNPEFTLLLLGCASIGVTLTTANPAYTEGEISRHMEHSGAKSIVTVPPLVHRVQEAGVKDITVIGWSEGSHLFSDILKDDGKAFPSSVDLNPKEDVILLPYSSGTTGLPKGVMLTHYNVVSNLLQFRNSLKTTTEDNYLGVLPFYHIYGMAPVLLGSLQDGAYMTTISKFDPEVFLTAIQRQKITKVMIVPPIVLFLARHPMVANYDLSSIQEVLSAAAPLGESLTYEFMDKVKLPIYQGYGLTETSPVTHLDWVPGTVGSIGRLISNTEGKIVNPETGEALARGETGEICIRGPQVMKGYLNNEKATKDMIDEDGWLHTGDIGHVKTENDCFVITDRLKELIKYKGMQVPPAELEDLLQKHPAVLDVAVVGMPDDRAGELPRAYVVCKPNEHVTPPEIIKFVEDHVADYKRLRGGVEFVKEIPRSPSGKILRRLLKDELASSQL